MIIGGLQKFSLLDFPGYLAAIIFTQGCNFRCQFCYNPMLVWPINEADKLQNKKFSEEKEKGYPLISEDSLFSFLRARLGKLDAIVITGGEPTLHPDLPQFIAKIRKLSFKIKLDTNGTNPKMLGKLIKDKMLDYIAMDIKASPVKYKETTQVKPNLNNIRKSLKLIVESGLPYEFRTTVVPGLLSEGDIDSIGRMIEGADKWYLQKFKNDTPLLNSSLSKIKIYSDQEMKKMRSSAEKYVKFCAIR